MASEVPIFLEDVSFTATPARAIVSLATRFLEPQSLAPVITASAVLQSSMSRNGDRSQRVRSLYWPACAATWPKLDLLD